MNIHWLFVMRLPYLKPGLRAQTSSSCSYTIRQFFGKWLNGAGHIRQPQNPLLIFEVYPVLTWSAGMRILIKFTLTPFLLVLLIIRFPRRHCDPVAKSNPVAIFVVSLCRVRLHFFGSRTPILIHGIWFRQHKGRLRSF